MMARYLIQDHRLLDSFLTLLVAALPVGQRPRTPVAADPDRACEATSKVVRDLIEKVIVEQQTDDHD